MNRRWTCSWKQRSCVTERQRTELKSNAQLEGRSNERDREARDEVHADLGGEGELVLVREWYLLVGVKIISVGL